MSVKPPRPGVKYTQGQIELMRAAYPDFQMPGHVMRYDEDGTISFVRWNQASYGGAYDPTRPQDLRGERVYTGEVEFDVKPIQKRTASQRLESLANSLMDGWQREGGIPTLQSGVAPRVAIGGGLTRAPTTQEKEEYARRRKLEEEENERTLNELVGELWKEGQPVTAEVVRAAAAKLLGQAENKFEASEAKKVTRTAPSD